MVSTGKKPDVTGRGGTAAVERLQTEQELAPLEPSPYKPTEHTSPYIVGYTLSTLGLINL